MKQKKNKASIDKKQQVLEDLIEILFALRSDTKGALSEGMMVMKNWNIPATEKSSPSPSASPSSCLSHLE